MTLREITATRLRAARLAKKLTLDQAAEKTRVARHYICRIENTRSVNLTLDVLEKLAEGYDKDVSWFVSDLPVETQRTMGEDDLSEAVEKAIDALTVIRVYLDRPE